MTRPEVTDQQLLPTQAVERQKTGMVILARKKPLFLMARHGVVRGIHLQESCRRRLGKRPNQGLDQDWMEVPGEGTASAIFPSAPGGRTGYRRIPADGRWYRQILTPRLMISEVLIAQRHAIHPLSPQRVSPLLTGRRVTRVRQGLCQPRRQSAPLIHRPEQHDPTSPGDRAATNFGLDPTPLTAWNCTP